MKLQPKKTNVKPKLETIIPMKKLFLTAMLSFLVLGAYAQKKVLKSAEKALRKGELEEAITLAKQAAANPETQDEPDVYITIGKAYLQQFVDSGKENFDAANAAYEHFATAMEKGDDKLREDMMEAPVYLPNDPEKPVGGGDTMGMLDQFLLQIGDAAWSEQNYEKAFQAFDLAAKIQERIAINFFAGVAAQSAEQEDVAYDYFVLVADSEEEYEYKKEAFNEVIRISRVKEDHDTALEYIAKAKELFPDDKTYASMEVDVLINAERLDEAVAGLKANIAAGNADKTQYYYLGYLQWSAGNTEEALEAANQALELDPDYYEALYIKGGAIYDKAAAILREANNTTDDAEYTKMRDQAFEMFKEAQPVFEKCYAQRQDDPYILKPLSTIYDQLQMDAKRDEILAKLDALEGGE